MDSSVRLQGPRDPHAQHYRRKAARRTRWARRATTREGLTAVLSVKLPDPKFSSQTKDKFRLLGSEGRGRGRGRRVLEAFLLEHPVEARGIVAKIIDAARARWARKGADDAPEGRSIAGAPIRRLPGEIGAFRAVPRRGVTPQAAPRSRAGSPYSGCSASQGRSSTSRSPFRQDTFSRSRYADAALGAASTAISIRTSCAITASSS